MLQAHWSGYEIDSSEAAYEWKVKEPEKLGTRVRSLLSSGYFVRSYYLLSELSLQRLRDYVAANDPDETKLLAALDKQIAKSNDRRFTTVGVRVIEQLLNYAGAHRQELLAAQPFRFELTQQQQEMREDYGDDEEFEPGGFIDEGIYYSSEEIPWDGVVLALGCQLVGADKLAPAEQRRAYKAVHASYKQVGLLVDLGSWFGPAGDVVQEAINRRHDLSLRVRLNPDATFTTTGRWMDDGQFILPYYEYLLELAAKKTGIDLGLYVL